MTASPGELRLMLLDGALRFAARAREGLAGRDYEAAYEGTTRCQDILLELINGLRPDLAPDLCPRLGGLYTFLYRRLMEASGARDPAIVDEVIRLLAYERETWRLLLEKLARESARSGQSADTRATAQPPEPAAAQGVPNLPPPAAAAPGPGAGGPSISVRV
jgi:flagellar protein FliS